MKFKEKLNITDNGNSQYAIYDEGLRAIAFVPKLHPECEDYLKLFTNAPKLLKSLEYLTEHYLDFLKSDHSPFALRSEIDNAKELINEITS